MNDDLDNKIQEWFGIPTGPFPKKKKKRRTKKEMMEDYRVTCKKCNHSWLNLRG